MSNNLFIQLASQFHNWRSGIWFVGISSWVFGIADRSFAALADGYLSMLDLLQLLTTSFFLISWLFLKPGSSSRS